MMMLTTIPTDETMYEARPYLRAPSGSIAALLRACAVHAPHAHTLITVIVNA